MATLMGSVPAGLTFQDLVGEPAPRASATPDRAHAGLALPRHRLMRIGLPDGGVQETTPTQCQEFLATYRFTHAPGDVAEDTSQAA